MKKIVIISCAWALAAPSWAQNNSESCAPTFAVALATAQDLGDKFSTFTQRVEDFSDVIDGSNQRVDAVVGRVDLIMNTTVPLILDQVEVIRQQGANGTALVERIYKGLPALLIGSLTAAGACVSVTGLLAVWTARWLRDRYCPTFGVAK
jgi:hypothetical protein